MDDEQLADLLGAPVGDLQRVGGGDVCDSWRARSGESWIFVKSLTEAPDGFFHAEARGLRWIAESGQISVPEVLAVGDGALILEWIEPVRPSARLAEDFGRSLAHLHGAGADVFGRLDGDGFIATLPLSNRPVKPDPAQASDPGATAGWAEFFAEERIRPFLRTARDRAAISPDDCSAVEAVLDRLADISGPPEPPARIHGDLWAGNLLWGDDGRVRLIDAAAACGGHRETDLAMLALFGAPHLDEILAAYVDAWSPADGWQDRTALHQLHPVLVHAVMFGGSYGTHAGRLARACLRI